MSWLLTWMFNPAMLVAGAAAISVPIVIHLLNKRRFRIVDWAAMDFLFDADKKNRRRIRLENLILLALRCLAMLLLGLLLARPFLPSELAGRLGQAQEFQRVMVVDDSLSPRVLMGSRPAFDEAKDRIKQLIQMLARDQNADYLTLFLTSQPDKPVMVNEAITPDAADNLLARIDELQCSDNVAQYDEALAEVRSYVESDRSTANPVVYVLTDLRQRDWQAPTSSDAENAPHKILSEISNSVPNTFIVDVGSVLEENLVITDVRAEDLLVANSIVRFSVSVTNFGERTAENVGIRFRVDELQPVTDQIAAVAPGQTETLVFPYLFQIDRDEFDSLDFQEQLVNNLVNYRVTAEIVQDGKTRDHLKHDSIGYFAARTLQALPILIVDGDPSVVPERSESYYLQSIGLPGTGLLVDSATAGELETVSLSKYRVIFLCNVDEASPDRVQSLQQWVADGGGLVLMPGDRVRATTFNETFYKQGNGLSPLELRRADGDATKNDWVFMEVIDPQHPALRVTLDEDVGMGKVELFSWWETGIREDQVDKVVSVPIRLSNPDNSPAMAEKTLGDGRVVTFAFSADADWTMWPAHPTYICVMWDLVNYLVGDLTEMETTRVGGSASRLVDLSMYDLRVSLTDPAEEKVETIAQPLDPTAASQESVLYQVRFDDLGRRGFYEMNLRRQTGEIEPTLFAVNVHPGEGDLKRLDVNALPDDFFGPQSQVLTADELVQKNESNTSNEIWPQVLLMLAVILGAEQLLGWWFGRRR